LQPNGCFWVGANRADTIGMYSILQ
jgi:acetyltransferase-like isoleucine patch superfamily enzyme